MTIQTHPAVQDALNRLEGQLTGIFQARQLAGMAAALIYDQGIIWSKGFGCADIENQVPAGTNTVFDVGSIVKIFTDTMLMQVRDAGLVNLDDPIEKHLPAFKLKPAGNNEPAPTFRHTAAHIAGIPREPSYFIGEKGCPELPAMDVILENVKDMSYIYPPMEGVHYSNLGVYVMGHALAKITGKPYKQYVHEHILQPLGMNSSGWEFTPGMEAHRAKKYIPLHGGKPRMKASAMEFGDSGAPGGGFSSSVEDMARFIAFQFHEGTPAGNRILSPSSLKEMRLPVFYESWGGLGIGWWLDRVCNHKTIHHGGSAPGCSAAIRLVPDLKLGVVILVNEMIFTENQMARDALEMVIPAFEQALSEQRVVAPRPPLPAGTEACAGHYTTPGDAWTLDVAVESNNMKARIGYAGLDLLGFNVIHEKGLHYVIEGSSFDKEKLSFCAGTGGKITSLLLWGLPFQKVLPPAPPANAALS